MRKEQKIKKDQHTLKKYMKKLQNERKEICRKAEVYAQGGHRNRVNAIGEAVLKLLDDLNKQQADLEIRGKKMLNGTLFWLFEEQKVKDTDGIKGYRYTIGYMVKTSEPKHTEEEIQQELRETYAKFKAETEEMYGETTDEEYGFVRAEDLEAKRDEVKSEE